MICKICDCEMVEEKNPPIEFSNKIYLCDIKSYVLNDHRYAVYVNKNDNTIEEEIFQYNQFKIIKLPSYYEFRINNTTISTIDNLFFDPKNPQNVLNKIKLLSILI